MADATREAVSHAVEQVMRERMQWSVPLSDEDWRKDAEAVADAALHAIENTEAHRG
jgi:hypothetical protein